MWEWNHMQFCFFFTLLLLGLAIVVPPSLAGSLKDFSKIADTEDFTPDKSKHAAIYSSRRNLTGGSCAPTNPIDNCWRCKPNWAEDRQALAGCALGYGKGTTGGKGGEVYVVTDPSDTDPANPKEGTLRWAVTRDKPLWVTFGQDMVINLQQELIMTGDKTIDGRGAKVEIANGGGISLPQVTNVIIHSIHIHDIRATRGGNIRSSETKQGPRHPSDGDGICVFGSSKVWIDHVSMSKAIDGLIDVTLGSTAVTISNCKFNDHNKVILLGADKAHTQDKNMKVSVAYNKFSTGCVQRMPRCRFGFFQVVNNDYEKWEMYAIGGSSQPTIISQGNRFCAPDDKRRKEVTQRAECTPEEWKQWNWRSKNDLFLNGAFFTDSGVDVPPTPEMIPPEPADSMDTLVRDAGILTCSPGKPC